MLLQSGVVCVVGRKRQVFVAAQDQGAVRGEYVERTRCGTTGIEEQTWLKDESATTIDCCKETMQVTYNHTVDHSLHNYIMQNKKLLTFRLEIKLC